MCSITESQTDVPEVSNQGKVMGNNRLELAWKELSNRSQDEFTF